MLIDTQIRDTVLLPMLVFVVLMTLVRVKIFNLLNSNPSDSEKLEIIKQKNWLSRSQRLRANGAYITPLGFALRRAGLERELDPSRVQDQAVDMMASMGGQKVGLINQALFFGVFYAIQNAMSGFLVVKMPFALTERFKQLTQQGIGIPSLDTSFVSSGSWYMIALNGIQRLIELAGASSGLPDEAAMMQMQMGMMPGMGGNQQQFMATQAFKAELEQLSVCHYQSALVRTERELLSQRH